MKAVFLRRHGGPEVLEYGVRPDPKPGPGEVLVSVRACALNHLDIWVRQGLPGVSIPLPHIPGSDVCGVVLSTGPGAGRFKRGQRVIVSPGQVPPGDPEGYAARDSYSHRFRIMGLQTPGGYAEKVVAEERFVVPVSSRWSDAEWAALPLAGLTAYHMLVTRAGLRAGETVLVHAAGSGIGAYAVQIAKTLGATVLTTVGDPRKVTPALKLGADEVIQYRREDFSEKVRALTGGRGVDVIFEHIGPETWPKNLTCLARGGRMVTCGATSGPKAEVDIRYLYSKQLSILGSYMGSFAELSRVIEMAEGGTLRPVVDRTYSLRRAAEAHRRMESRANFGKIVLRVR
ncbi:MAG: Quinone oxidoreductase 1 [Candidatus Omnitrophica bacterium]|nr:Quinone oxidoreductase 1 [Candidatus Omnitrophota bacterium]